jgi:thiamine-monophosphate kinase
VTISDEFGFIQKIQPKGLRQPSVLKGIGDDAALFEGNSSVDEIVCMDTMMEEIHFSRRTMSAFAIGYRALASNLSDIAAMGGIPTFYLVSIAVPVSWSENELIEVYKGMEFLATRYEIDLIGGDTVSSKQGLVITITALGRIEKGRHLLRSNAMEGDVVFVTGTIGDASAGLALLLERGWEDKWNKQHDQFLVERHQLPTPRIDIGRQLATYQRVALNDVSDGLASEANEIAEASAISLFIDIDALPKSEALKRYPQEEQIYYMLYGGEDYELLGTMPLDDWLDFKQKSDSAGLPITKIGQVESGAGVYINKNGARSTIRKKGYNHFS